MGSTKIPPTPTLELARQLTPLDKVRLIEGVAPDLEAPLSAATRPRLPLQSAYGICADLAPVPSAADIDEERQEAFGNFPREDL